ncbi:TRAP transporter small permease [Streptomonospora wellingtoniae]|uniref:TRAP transporter small permease n=1 Tax=Streptomonospora wellingtoniae TaxID=3075544 RepID=A0ABU2KNP9_9ACTN|nr:TRAP transporter small permease [Streptomonospora sp. DSM 45055]MDT0300890.1 TRAP transporter small permease [Streptomonospora sp. DSM 45055]
MPPKFQSIARGVLRAVDRTTDTLALTALAAVVLVVTWQVFGRYVLQASPRWGSEVALILLAWVGYLGIAIGLREHTHIGVTFITDRLPRRLRTAAETLTPLAFLAFALYLVFQGWQFTVSTAGTTLPATGLPSSVQYAVMPVTGVLVAVYSVLQLLGVDTRRDTRPPGEEDGAHDIAAAPGIEAVPISGEGLTAGPRRAAEPAQSRTAEETEAEPAPEEDDDDR